MQAAEEVLRAGLLKLGGDVLGRLLAADPGYRGPRVDCGNGHQAVFASYRGKVIDTVLGAVTLTGPGITAGLRARPRPRDGELGAAGASMSPGLAAMTTGPRRPRRSPEAAGLLEDLAGVRLTAKRVERAAEAGGAALAAAVRDRAALIACRKLAPLPPSPLPDKLYAVIDGTGVPMTARETAGREGKGEDGRARTREVKLAVFFTQGKLDKDGYPVRDRGSASVIATFEPAAAFGSLVKAEGIRRGADHVRQLTILGDGAAWIWNIATAKFPGATQIVDLFHAREHLHDLARSLEFMLGDRKDEWLAARLEDLDYGDIDGICKRRPRPPPRGRQEGRARARRSATSRTTRPACATTGSASAACSSAPASWKPAANPSSASASSSPACTGPSTAPTPSPPSAASRPAAPKTRSGHAPQPDDSRLTGPGQQSATPPARYRSVTYKIGVHPPCGGCASRM